MSEVVLDIKAWGNNLGVRLPAAIARAANLHAHQRVKITVVDGQIIITPELQQELTLAQRLDNFVADRHGGEAMATTEVLGVEQW